MTDSGQCGAKSEKGVRLGFVVNKGSGSVHRFVGPIGRAPWPSLTPCSSREPDPFFVFRQFCNNRQTQKEDAMKFDCQGMR